MKNYKKTLFLILLVFVTALISSCDGLVIDEITPVGYSVYSYRQIPRYPPIHLQSHPRRFEPNRKGLHDNFQPRTLRTGRRGALQSGRDFNRH